MSEKIKFETTEEMYCRLLKESPYEDLKKYTAMEEEALEALDEDEEWEEDYELDEGDF